MEGLVNAIIKKNSNELKNEGLYKPLKYRSENLPGITRYFTNQMKKYNIINES